MVETTGKNPDRNRLRNLIGPKVVPDPKLAIAQRGAKLATRSRVPWNCRREWPHRRAPQPLEVLDIGCSQKSYNFLEDFRRPDTLQEGTHVLGGSGTSDCH